jgi:hypothetical protein
MNDGAGREGRGGALQAVHVRLVSESDDCVMSHPPCEHARESLWAALFLTLTHV